MLIDVVGEGGGLMVDCGIWFDEAKHESVKAMVDFAKEYGVYPGRFEVKGLRTEATHLAD